MVVKRQLGFTYFFVLILLAISAAAILGATNRWSDENQRHREVLLLRTGLEIRSAIGSYYESSPGAVKRYPPDLDSLLLDVRYLAIKRHLRRIPLDPITETADWNLILAPDGGVMGVASPSELVPFKSANFSIKSEAFKNAGHYFDWQFVYMPNAPVISAVDSQH